MLFPIEASDLKLFQNHIINLNNWKAFSTDLSLQIYFSCIGGFILTKILPFHSLNCMYYKIKEIWHSYLFLVYLPISLGWARSTGSHVHICYNFLHRFHMLCTDPCTTQSCLTYWDIPGWIQRGLETLAIGNVFVAALLLNFQVSLGLNSSRSIGIFSRAIINQLHLHLASVSRYRVMRWSRVIHHYWWCKLVWYVREFTSEIELGDDDLQTQESKRSVAWPLSQESVLF